MSRTDPLALAPTAAEGPQADEIWGVVLVGGRSSRMGRDKAALLHPAGGTFLDHAIGRLRRLSCPTAICGSTRVPPAWAQDLAVVAIPDPPMSAQAAIAGPPQPLGPVAGIVAALLHSASAGATGILVTPVDMPHLSREHLRPLLEAARQSFAQQREPSPPEVRQPIVGTFDGIHREPLVAAYPVAALAALQQLAAGNDRSLSRWLATHPHHLHRLPAAAAANVNTPAQYQSECDT